MPVLCETRLFSVSAYYHEATLSVFSPYTSPGLSPVKSFHSVPLLLAPSLASGLSTCYAIRSSFLSSLTGLVPIC